MLVITVFVTVGSSALKRVSGIGILKNASHALLHIYCSFGICKLACPRNCMCVCWDRMHYMCMTWTMLMAQKAPFETFYTIVPKSQKINDLCQLQLSTCVMRDDLATVKTHTHDR